MSAIENIQNLLARGFVTVSHGAKKMRELQAEFLAGEVRDNLEQTQTAAESFEGYAKPLFLRNFLSVPPCQKFGKQGKFFMKFTSPT